MPPHLFKPLLSACCLLLLLSTAYAQTPPRDSIDHFPNEIGVDFAPFTRGQTGFSLLSKRAVGRTKIAKWQKRTAIRTLFGNYSETLSNGGVLPRRGDTIFLLSSLGDAYRYFINAGIERQLSTRKFRFYFGSDIGYRGSTYKGNTQNNAVLPSATFLYDTWKGEVRTNGPELSLFAGANFFFWRRLSIGLEISYSMGIEFSKTKIIRNGQVTRTDKNTVFDLDTRIPRLLYLSYHFRT